jgi:hypothetical protein
MSRTFPLRLPESIRRAAEDLAREGDERSG